jgi:hypothetical protein
MAIDTRQSDNFCNRLLFKQQFNPRKDIYVSFQTPELPRLITEDSQFLILTEDGFALIVDTFTSVTFFVATTADNGAAFFDPSKGNPGIGTGLLSLSSTGKENVSGHIMSTCLDFYGGYGLKNQFLSAGDKGVTELQPNSVTVRLSTTGSAYEHLSTQTIDDFDVLNTDFKSFRISFKEHLNRVNLDIKRSEEENFSPAFTASNTFPQSGLPDLVYIGIASSGNEAFTLKDITYSGDIS